MPPLNRNNFLITWDMLFAKHLARPIFILMALIPVVVFVVVEFQARQNLNASLADIQSELSQIIVSGDSYMATRVVKSLGKSLQLKSVQLYAQNNILAEFGQRSSTYLNFIYWNSERQLYSTWGENVGIIKVQSTLLPIQRVISITFILFSYLWLIFLLTMSNKYKKQTVPIINEIQNLTSEFNSFEENKIMSLNQKPVFITQTAFDLFNAFERFFNSQSKLILKNSELEKNQAITSLARQVAHDIRSPLAALNMISSTLSDVPVDKRIMIRNSIQRINDIANDLLSKSKINRNQMLVNEGQSLPYAELILLPSLVDALVSEKRIQFRDYLDVNIQTDFADSFGVFVKVNAKDLMRVLSNLINNSVEAMDKKKGEILISIRVFGNKVLLSIKDNGKGIPDEVMQILGSTEFSYGKAESSSGNGLGVYSAKKIIDSFEGRLQISSKLGVGSQLDIVLPKQAAPVWFLQEISLKIDSEIICLDDDLSIHQIWKNRLQNLNFENNGICFTNFTSPLDFTEYIQRQANLNLSNKLFLIDFEYLGHAVSGLDIIEKFNLQENAVLVTSRYEELEIQKRCEMEKVKILPKMMSGFVPIVIKNEMSAYDVILIDDDELVHMSWQISANVNNKKFIGFKSYEDFKLHQMHLNTDARVFIDSNLGDGLKGEDIAKFIFADGFRDIFLCTGFDSCQFSPMSWIKGIVSKDPQI